MAQALIAELTILRHDGASPDAPISLLDRERQKKALRRHHALSVVCKQGICQTLELVETISFLQSLFVQPFCNPSIILVNSLSRTGFVKNMSKPELKASRCAEALPSPVRAIMVAGSRPRCCSNPRICLVDSNPFSTGMLMSMRIICGLRPKADPRLPMLGSGDSRHACL